jgi:hypothetical protein
MIVLFEDERQGKALMDRIPPERRAMLTPMRVEQAAERLQAYIDAGFRGFTFSNQTLPTPEAIGLAGELIKLLR